MGLSRDTAQLIGSLAAAAVVVALTIVAVTAKLGPTATAELDAREQRLELQLEREEERREALEELRER